MNILASVGIVLVLILFSAICSGLNIALMALDVNDLRRKAKLGNRAATRVLPLRQKTHLTLASILLTNVAAVSATSLVLEQNLNGFVAGAIGTLLIVIFGEVLPQALFAKSPLAWTSGFAPILKVMIVISYPIAKPLQLLLNQVIGHAPHTLHSRDELGLMITEHLGPSVGSELDEDEVEIIRGALQLSEKQIGSIMTPIEQTYWLTPDEKLTDAKIDEIKLKGFSRIPIMNRNLTQCFGILLMKELVDIDFDAKVYRVDDLTLHPVKLVGSRTALDTMLRKFINVGTHLIPVERDDKIVGIVTIEDLIEEIVGHEIEDETDRARKHRR